MPHIHLKLLMALLLTLSLVMFALQVPHNLSKNSHTMSRKLIDKHWMLLSQSAFGYTCVSPVCVRNLTVPFGIASSAKDKESRKHFLYLFKHRKCPNHNHRK